MIECERCGKQRKTELYHGDSAFPKFFCRECVLRDSLTYAKRMANRMTKWIPELEAELERIVDNR
jgi:hypothetical protein